MMVTSRIRILGFLIGIGALVVISMGAGGKFFDPKPRQDDPDSTRQVRLTATSEYRHAAVNYDCADGKGIQTAVIDEKTFKRIFKVPCNSIKGRVATIDVFPDWPHPVNVGCSAYMVGYNAQGMFKAESANQLGCEVLVF